MPDESQKKLEKAPSKLDRRLSTPVRPAVWMTSVLAWATVVGLFLRIPDWAGIFLCAITGLSFLSYLIPYLYLLVNDRESLRQDRLFLDSSIITQKDDAASDPDVMLLTEPARNSEVDATASSFRSPEPNIKKR